MDMRFPASVLLLARATVLAAVMLAAWPRPGVAEDAPPTLAQLILSAQRDNKDLAAARRGIEVSDARLVQAGLLPNPRLNVSGASDFAFRGDGAYAVAMGISQDVSISGRIARQQDVGRVDVALTRAEVLDAERRLAGDVAADVYRILIADRRRENIDAAIEFDRRLARTTRIRYQAAEVSQLDVNVAALDLQRLLLDRARLQAQREALAIQLNLRLGRAPASVVDLSAIPLAVAPLPVSVDAPTALRGRPDFAVAALQVDRADAEVALARARRWDDWSIGVGVQQDRQVVDGAPHQRNDRALKVSVTVPLPLARRSRAEIATALAGVGERRARRDALQMEIESEIAAARAATAGPHAVITGYQKDVLPVAKSNATLAARGYAQGLVPLIDVAQAQRQLSDLQNAYLGSLDDYLQSVVRLHVAVGDYPLLDRTQDADQATQEAMP